MTPALSTNSSIHLGAKSDDMIPITSTLRFLNLPFELRQFVYLNLIDYQHPGDIASILRVNKQVNVEAMAVVLKKYYLVCVELSCHKPLLEVILTRLPHIRSVCSGDNIYALPTVKWLLRRTTFISMYAHDEHNGALFQCKNTFLLFGPQALREFFMILSQVGLGRRVGRRHIAVGISNCERKPAKKEEQELLQTIADSCFGFYAFSVNDFEDFSGQVGNDQESLRIQMANLRRHDRGARRPKTTWWTSLRRADLDDSVMYYEAAQHMVSFFLQTGEIVRDFGLDNDPQKQSRFTQMRFAIALDLTTAHLSSMKKTRPWSNQQAEVTINSANVALRHVDSGWKPDAKQEAQIHFAGGCAQKVLNKLEEAERSFVRALELLLNDTESRHELDEVRVLLQAEE